MSDYDFSDWAADGYDRERDRRDSDRREPDPNERDEEEQTRPWDRGEDRG